MFDNKDQTSQVQLKVGFNYIYVKHKEHSNNRRESIIIVQTACGIKRLFGKISRPPTSQSVYFDHFKSEAEYRLGYFVFHEKGKPEKNKAAIPQRRTGREDEVQ